MKVQYYTESNKGRTFIPVSGNSLALFNTMLFDMFLLGAQIQSITPTKVHLFAPINSIVTVVNHLEIEGNLEEMQPFYKFCKEIEVNDSLSGKMTLGSELYNTPHHLSKLNPDPVAKVRDLKAIVLRMLHLPEDGNYPYDQLSARLFEGLSAQ